MVRVQGEDAVLMQFTGLHDKNGKEIYEGDLVRPRSGDIAKCDDALATWYAAPHEIISAWEVIGNIYESPELLR